MDNPVKPQCRLCLETSSKEYASITDLAWRFKLGVVFKFELTLNDSLSNLACKKCCTKIDDFYDFHESVQTNQIQLKTARMTDDTMLWLVEVKGEPMDEEDTEGANLDESSPTVDDHESKPKTEPELIQNKDIQKIPNKGMPDDNWKIEQFFNGIKCSICSEKFKTFGKLKTHCRKAHDQKASITCCDRKYFKKVYLIDHINSHQGSNRFHCELCNKNYTSGDYLRIHNMQFHTNSEELPCQCSTCGKRFSRESLLKAHLKLHVQVNCSVCDRTMANIHSLKVHMLKMHSEQPREAVATHICDTCGQVYHQKTSLERHIKLQHLGDKDTDRIQCPVCTKWVNNKQYLKVHIRNAHSGENLQVVCDICQRVCLNKRSLSSHKNKVHAKRQLKCEVCGKMFKLPKHLKEHRAAHMGQQLYTCTVCGYGSNYNGNLYTHMKNKHPVEYTEARTKGETLMATQVDV